MHRKIISSLWVDFSRSRYFLIPENQEIPAGDFLLFDLIGKKKKVIPIALVAFEIAEEEALSHLENELNQLIGQIAVSEDIQQELPEMLEEMFSDSNIKKHLSDFVKQLREIEDQIEQSPELLQQAIYEFYTSLSQRFCIEQEKQLDEKRRQEYRKSAKEAIAQSLRSFSVPSFADTDWTSEINFLIDVNGKRQT